MDQKIHRSDVLKAIEIEFSKQMNVQIGLVKDDDSTIGIYTPFRADKQLLTMIKTCRIGFIMSTIAPGFVPNKEVRHLFLHIMNEINDRLVRGCFCLRDDVGLCFDTFIHCREDEDVSSVDLFSEVKYGVAAFQRYLDEIMEFVDKGTNADEYRIQE